MSSKSSNDGYEKNDARTKPLWIAAVFLLALMIASVFAMKGMLAFFLHQSKKDEKQSFFVRDERWQAPSIQLEVHPSKDYETFKAEQDKMLHEYAWIDPVNNIIRIPVERAIELTAKRGLPARNGHYEDAGKALIPQESGSIAESRL